QGRATRHRHLLCERSIPSLAACSTGSLLCLAVYVAILALFGRVPGGPGPAPPRCYATADANLPPGGLTPYAAIQAQSFHTPSYNESDLTSGGFALGFNSRSATDTRSELGGRFDRLLLLNPDAALTLRARVAWAHDWISDPSLAALFQTLPGASFVVN